MSGVHLHSNNKQQPQISQISQMSRKNCNARAEVQMKRKRNLRNRRNLRLFFLLPSAEWPGSTFTATKQQTADFADFAKDFYADPEADE
jgi:hypothetical protein